MRQSDHGITCTYTATRFGFVYDPNLVGLALQETQTLQRNGKAMDLYSTCDVGPYTAGVQTGLE